MQAEVAAAGVASMVFEAGAAAGILIGALQYKEMTDCLSAESWFLEGRRADCRVPLQKQASAMLMTKEEDEEKDSPPFLMLMMLMMTVDS